MTNQLSLIVSGLWQKGGTIANKAVTRMNVGNTDFWYKAEKGYIGYSKGKSEGLADYSTHGTNYGFVYNRALWDEVLKPYHDLPDDTGPPAEFVPGARIVMIVPASVRASASASAQVLGTLPVDSLGTVMAGPQSADSVVWWQVYADNGLTGWIRRDDFQAAPTTEYLTTIAGGTWQNRALEAQSGVFSISFNFWAGAANMDGVTGLSAASAAGFSDLAVAVRFANTGVIDARNGGSFQSVNPLNYQPGLTYRVNLSVNLTNHTYSATVTPPGGAAVVIAENFAFRTEQAAVSSLSNIGAVSTSGSHTTSGIELQSAATPPSAPTGLRVIEN
jgi:hypothetical protein